MVSDILYYNDGSKRETVPSWAQFFIELGSITSSSTRSGLRLVVGVAIPTRSYAAALTGFGIVTTRSTLPVDGITAQEYFKQLCRLEVGTAVSLIRGNRKLKGVFTGCMHISGEDRIGVRVHDVEAGGLTHLISAKDSFKVEVSISEFEKLPKKQTGKLVPPLSSFARCFISKNQVQTFARQSRLECVLLGRINAFKSEIIQTGFATKTSKQYLAEGTLQDVLRVRRFMKEGEHFRSEVFRVDGKRPPITDFANPYITIFHGATGFLKWRDSQLSSNWIVLLDRTEPYFGDAAALLIQGDNLNRIDDESLQNLPPVPQGVEIVSYYELCR